MFSIASLYGWDSASGWSAVSASLIPRNQKRYFLVKLRRKSLNEAKVSSSEMVVPQMRPSWAAPPSALASDVSGLLLANEAVSDPCAVPPLTTLPASSRMMRRGARGVRKPSGWISPRRERDETD